MIVFEFHNQGHICIIIYHGIQEHTSELMTFRLNRTVVLNNGKHAIGMDTFGELANSDIMGMHDSKMVKAISKHSCVVALAKHADEFRNLHMCDDKERKPKSSTKKRTELIREQISEMLLVNGLFFENPMRKMEEFDMYTCIDDLSSDLQQKPTTEGQAEDELTINKRRAKEQKRTINKMLDRLVPDKDKGSIWPVDINWDDSGSENGDSEGKEKTNTKPKAMGKRKILVDGNKVLIGSSWQDRMTFDGRNVSFKNPFKEGIDLIKKDKAKEKKERQQLHQIWREKLAEKCCERRRHCDGILLDTLTTRALFSLTSIKDLHPDVMLYYQRNVALISIANN